MIEVKCPNCGRSPSHYCETTSEYLCMKCDLEFKVKGDLKDG